MVKIRTKDEIELMRESGRISALALKKVINEIRVGITEEELDDIVTKEIKKEGGKIAFTTVPDYHWATCITINDEVVHGIPGKRIIEEGDVVSVDLGVIYKGWYSDTAWSVLVGHDKSKAKFLSIGEEALWAAIKKAVAGNTIGDISNVIQTKVEGAGYSVVRSLVGHGIGKDLHEEPEVPGVGKPGTGLILQAGMSLAIEVIYNQGKPDVVIEDDNWTVSSADGTLGGLYEMTVIVGEKQPEILTDWRKV